MLPLLLPLIAGAAATSVGGGIARVFANNKAQKRNNAKLEELEALESGGTLGLNPAEQRLLDQRLNAPVAAATAAQQSRDEQLLASADTTTGADLARIRGDKARVQASAAQEAALQVVAADEQKRRQQLDELEQRLALQQSMRQDDISSVTGGLSQAFGAGAELAGSMPGTLQLSQSFGTRFADSERASLSRFMRENPEEASKMLADLLDQAG